MMLMYNGEEVNTQYLASLAGISHPAFLNRINTGWTLEEAVSTPASKNLVVGPNKVTKTDAERYLNDKKPWEVPPSLKCALDGYIRGAIGSHIRIKHKEKFDKWFSEDYCKIRES